MAKYILSETLPFDRLKAIPWKGHLWTQAEIKRDGRRLTVWKKPDGTLEAYSSDDRRDLDYVERYGFCLGLMDEFERWLAMPNGTIVEGELFVPGYPASEVGRSLKAEPGSRVPKWECFAVPMYGGEDLRGPQSLNGDMGFAAVHALIRDMNLEPIPHRTWPPSFHRSNWKEQEKFLLKATRSESDCEGWVLKQAPYEGWWKVKEAYNVDCIVTAWKEGTNKYLGLVGSLCVSVFDYEQAFNARTIWNTQRGTHTDPKDIRQDWVKAPGLVEVGFAGGMSDDDRLEMTELADEGKLIGRVCEVKHQYVGAGGRLRHPRFIRWREDKAPWDCLMSQLKSNDS